MTPSENQFSPPCPAATKEWRFFSTFSKWQVYLPLVLLIGISASTAPTVPSGDIPPELKRVVEGNTRFALDLYNQVAVKDRTNLFLSPYSISSALGMTYAAARGDTEKQISQTLHFPVLQKDFHTAMLSIRDGFDAISKNGNVQLNVANGVWLQKDYGILPEYLELINQHYRSSLRVVNFSMESGSARQEMNSWVQQETKNKIKDFWSPGAISRESRLVILNAIYFKGDWASRFAKSDTKPEVFWVNGGTAKETPMMCQNKVFSYTETADIQILQMPYKGDDLSMVVMLPVGRDGLAALEQQLNPGKLTEWLSKFELRTVDLRFPKFKITSRYSMAPILTRIGMADAFDKKRADFTGMAPNKPLFVSEVEHAALVEVNEEGTVAAAATGVSIGCAKAQSPPPPAIFHADHPFVFLIRENHTGTILFLGRVVDPL